MSPVSSASPIYASYDRFWSCCCFSAAAAVPTPTPTTIISFYFTGILLQIYQNKTKHSLCAKNQHESWDAFRTFLQRAASFG